MISAEQARSVFSKLKSRSLDDGVKFYSSISNTHSAVFAVITFGTGPAAIQLISVYGSFDSKKLGGSVNVPSDLVGMACPQNALMRQFTVYKNDSIGDAYFKNPDNAIPPCDAFNYTVMVMGEGQDSFGIKSSSWKQGDADSYAFKISELTPVDLTNFQNAAFWCKKPLSTPKAENAHTARNVALIVAGSLLAAYILFFVLPLGYYRSKAASRRLLRGQNRF